MRHAAAVACLVAWVGAAAAAWADPRVAALDDPDFAARRAAQDRLLLDASVTASQLEAWSRGDLSPEQRHRLLVVARHHTLRGLRIAAFPAEGPGSIGVVQSPRPVVARPGVQTPGRGILITGVLPGFPSQGRLRVGDVMLSINGEPIPEGEARSELFQARMRAFRAGDRITLGVDRDGQTLRVDIPLANAEALPAMYPPPHLKLAQRFEEAWQEKLQTVYAPLLTVPQNVE